MDRIDNPVPEWAIVGIDAGDHVRVLASTHLTRAEIDERFEELLNLFDPLTVVRTPVRYVTLTVEAVDMAMAAGPDYATALSVLFRNWSPDRKKPEIETVRQIEP